MTTISIPSYKGISFYAISNITRVQGLSNYCKIYFADNSHPLIVAKVLHWFEEHLPADRFWRTHKSHLVNSNYVSEMNTSGKPYLILDSGEIVAVSRRRVKALKKASMMMNYTTIADKVA